LPLLERSRPDLIIGYFAYPPGEAAVRLGRSLGIPAVVGVLGSDVRIVRGSTRRAVSKALRKAAYVLGVSRDLCQHAVGLGADPERVIAIPNGCDGEIFRPGNRLQARHELGVSQESELIVYVGRLVALKGLRELFQAMAQLSQSNPSTELACIGDGPLAEELAACADRELRGRVRMLGSQAPKVIAKWLAAANLLCLPSHSEGCPNVVLEALSAGRPVVASEVGGVPDLLDAESGLLVKPRDPTSLSRAIELALRRAWDEDAIAAKSRRTWQDVAAETFGVCQRALASASSQAAPLGMLADKNNLWAKTS
jgi:glycosyltransferase involved in cell wall biosynthesis